MTDWNQLGERDGQKETHGRCLRTLGNVWRKKMEAPNGQINSADKTSVPAFVTEKRTRGDDTEHIMKRCSARFLFFLSLSRSLNKFKRVVIK